MANINRVTVAGNLGGDPEVRFPPNGQAVCNLSLAVNERWKDRDGNDQERTEWVRVQVWGKQAEACGQYLAKGRAVLVEGKMRTRSYEKDGVTKYVTEVVAERVHFLGGRGDGHGRREEPPMPSHDNDIPFAWLLTIGLGGMTALHALGGFIA